MYHFETDASAPIDDFAQADIDAGVGMKLGTLSAATSYSDSGIDSFEKHPDIGADIAEKAVPDWG